MEKRKFDEKFKIEVMKMKTGEDWNSLRKRYNLSEYIWDDEMKNRFEEILKMYSEPGYYPKRNGGT